MALHAPSAQVAETPSPFSAPRSPLMRAHASSPVGSGSFNTHRCSSLGSASGSSGRVVDRLGVQAWSAWDDAGRRVAHEDDVARGVGRLAGGIAAVTGPRSAAVSTASREHERQHQRADEPPRPPHSATAAAISSGVRYAGRSGTL